MTAAPHSQREPRTRSDLAKLALGALGVVYGDIGTSPLYAIKECFAKHNDALGRPLDAVTRTEANVLGILSLVFWSLVMVVVVKYLTFIMRADNEGEGGILALLALVAKRKDGTPRAFGLIALGLFGAALLYGDGIITPAISVLSAVEGLAVKPISELSVGAAETPNALLEKIVVPLTVLILVGLFVVQKRGTARVGAVFGPAMFIWFFAIAILGIGPIVANPRVLLAVIPSYAVLFLVHHGTLGFFVLGSVVLCITGGEALYADMGHFGRKPIKWAWYALVLPSLVLNYFGQGAELLSSRAASSHWRKIRSTRSRLRGFIIRSSASRRSQRSSRRKRSSARRVFSLTATSGAARVLAARHDSSHVGRSRRTNLRPRKSNYGLMVSCVALVLGFKHSDDLAAAYGIAVTGTMSITTILFFVLVREKWQWGMAKSLALCGLFLRNRFCSSSPRTP